MTAKALTKEPAQEMGGNKVKAKAKLKEERRDTLCWDCKRAVPAKGGAGGCRWSVGLCPVEGWKGTPTVIEGTMGIMRSFLVEQCPLFIRDEKDRVDAWLLDRLLEEARAKAEERSQRGRRAARAAMWWATAKTIEAAQGNEATEKEEPAKPVKGNKPVRTKTDPKAPIHINPQMSPTRREGGRWDENL